MKYVVLVFVLVFELYAASLKTTLLDVQDSRAEIEIEKIDVGVSGFVVRMLDENHSSILNHAVVESFDPQTKRAVLKLTAFETFSNNNLPKGKWKAKTGDVVVLAHGYSRAFLVAPTEDIYYKITKSVPSLQWIHPDIFASILSYEGHPTPLKSDFDIFSSELAVGLCYIYLDARLYTLDMSSFAILDIIDAPLVQNADELKLPFYTRVEEIDADWFGEGSDPLESYEPYYYELMVKHNQNNQRFYDIIKKSDEKLHKLLKEFEIKE